MQISNSNNFLAYEYSYDEVIATLLRFHRWRDKQVSIQGNLFTNHIKSCIVLSLLLLFNTIELKIDNVDDFHDFDNWLKINYQGLYGWQKIRQIFLDNFVPCNDFEKEVVQKIKELELPSTFGIKVYAPILR